MTAVFRVTHAIGGVVFRVASSSEIPYYKRIASFAKYRVSDDLASDVTHIYQEVTPDSLTLPPLSGEQRAWLRRVPRTGVDSVLLRSPKVWACVEASLPASPHIYIEQSDESFVILDLAQSRMTSFFSSTRLDALQRSRYMSSLLAPFLPAFSASMVHSSAVMVNGRAALFLAPDEGGKTTVARQAPDSNTVLCDDQNIVRIVDGQVEVHSTPWGLLGNGPQHARLGGIFLLEQADHFRLTPIQAGDILQYLWNEHIGCRIVLSREYRTRLFDIFYRIAHSAPAYLMHFDKTGIRWDEIDAAMAP